ncbi:MAG: prephenate dehydrogenase [Spirochaetes bacterium]|nr:MAG: prephenate dehydrogenase [Spirochaetota bacterium]
MFSRIAVFGLGLLGGSICRGLRSISHQGEIIAFARDPGKLGDALRGRVIDRVISMEAARLDGIDLLIICTPVFHSIELLNTILNDSGLGATSLVIDVGSVKSPIVEAALANPRADRFVGCHPMAGSERTGYGASRHDLYNQAPVIITPHARNARGDIEKVAGFWRSLGAVVVEAEASFHDSVVARTSHLPHLLACSAMHAIGGLAESMGPGLTNFMGNGFRDVTRIAAGSPEMWADIFAANGTNIAAAARDTIKIIEDVIARIEANGDPRMIADFFDRARELRKGI